MLTPVIKSLAENLRAEGDASLSKDEFTTDASRTDSQRSITTHFKLTQTRTVEGVIDTHHDIAEQSGNEQRSRRKRWWSCFGRCGGRGND